MFKLSLDCKWNNECFYQQLLSNASNQDLYGVKIYRHHREHINRKGEDAVNDLLSKFYEADGGSNKLSPLTKEEPLTKGEPLTKEVLMDDPDAIKPKSAIPTLTRK